MASVAVPAPFSIDNTYGPYFMSSLICVALWGMLCLQTFWYFAHYEKDNKYLKLTVVALWFLATGQTYLVVAGVYTYLISQFGNWLYFSAIAPSLWAQIILGTIAENIVQAMFIHRLYNFSEGKLWIVPALWFPVALYGLIAAFVYVFRSITAGNSDIIVQPVMQGLGISYIAVSAVIDVSIAFLLARLLLKQRQYIHSKSSAQMVQRLVMFSIASGGWTAVFSVLDIILYCASKQTTIWVIFDLPICTLYCNTLLANLNGRAYITGKNSVVVDEHHLSTFQAVNVPPPADSQNTLPEP